MSRAENRHHTFKWKQRRKHKGGDKCGNAQCPICHSNKVSGIPTRQQQRAKVDIEFEREYDLGEMVFDDDKGFFVYDDPASNPLN